MRVRKKPVEVEAMFFNEKKAKEVSDWCNGLLICRGENTEPFIQIMTLEGMMTARLGDYIIKGVHGEFYPCAPAIFEKTYEVISE
jgi:hypothetical protein